MKQRKYNYDYSKLKGKMREYGIIYKDLSDILGISMASVSERMNNNAQFTQDQIERTTEVLEIPTYSIWEYFFTHKV